MRILWASNAPWVATGYGQQTALMLPRLRDAGHEVACAANYGLAGAVLEWEGFKVYPQGREWSNDTIPVQAQDWFDDGPGLLIVLYDAWVLDSPAYSELDMAVWCPVDHTPAPPRVAGHFQRHGSTPIAMSRWGERQLRLHGLEPLYAPHGIDVSVFTPHDKAEAKRKCGFPADRFLVGMVSTNNSAPLSRKAYPEAFAAYALFHHEHPDSLLYVHAEHQGNQGGMDLERLATARGIPAGTDALIFVDEFRYRLGGFTPAHMAWLYSAFDVLLFPSYGEGFGIPALEAQACGTPVIVTDFSAQSELIAPDTGWRIPGQPFWDDVLCSDYAVPSIEGLYRALIAARDDTGESEKCRAFALSYDADAVFESYWVPVLDALSERLPSLEPITV